MLHWGLGDSDRSWSLQGAHRTHPARARDRGEEYGQTRPELPQGGGPLTVGGQERGVSEKRRKPGSRAHGSLTHVPGTEKQAGLSRVWLKALS